MIQKKLKNKLMGAAIATTLVVSLLSPGALLFAQTATTTNATTTEQTSTTTGSVATTTYSIMIMKHLCNSNITNLNDFLNLGAGQTYYRKFLNSELNCPTSAIPGDVAPSGSITGPRTNFDFQVQNTNGTTTQTLKNNGTYIPNKICESSIGVDIDLNGTIASSTCLDASSYELNLTSTSSQVTVNETNPSPNSHFGAVLFTPDQIAPNNDDQDLIGTTSSGVMNFNLASDTDKMIMLHVFNIQNATTTATTTPGNGGTGTTTPPVTGTTTPPVTGTTTPPVTGTTTPLSDIDKQFLLDLIQGLQNQLNALRLQIQNLISELNHHPRFEGDGVNNNSGAHVVAAQTTVVEGDTDDFAGDHFGSNEQVIMSSNGNTLMTLTTDKEGNFGTGSIIVPYVTGNKTYTFTGQTSRDVVNVTLHIVAIP